MDKNMLLWSCNRSKFWKVCCSKDVYKERLGFKQNSVWFLEIKRHDKPKYESYEMEGYRYHRYDAYSFWELFLNMEFDLVNKHVRVKLILDTKIYEDHNLYFTEMSTRQRIGGFDTSKLVDYRMDLVLIFPETTAIDTSITEECKILKLDYLSNDFQSMLDKEHMSDVVLRCNGDEFKAHKNVLCSRSSVFQTMFAIPMQESDTGVVNIADVDVNVFRAFIQFLYSGHVTVTSISMACNLLHAAEKYQVKSLKEGLVSYMNSVLCCDNVIQILQVADLYDENLKAAAIHYIKTHLCDLEDTQEFQELKTTKPVLSLEIYSYNE